MNGGVLGALLGCLIVVAVTHRRELWGRLRGYSDWFQGYFCPSCDALLREAPYPGDACHACGVLCKAQPGWSAIPVRVTGGARWHYRFGFKHRLERKLEQK